jgi:hypothetical protein
LLLRPLFTYTIPLLRDTRPVVRFLVTKAYSTVPSGPGPISHTLVSSVSEGREMSNVGN